MSADGMAGTTAGHNSAARPAVIRQIIADRRKIDGEIAELMTARKKIQGRIKSDLGMKVSDFNSLYRIASLEDEARDEFLDTLREGFAALGIGQQASFLDAIAPVVQMPDRPRGKLPTIEECEALGGISFRQSLPEDDFPETITTKARKEAFVKGWHKAKVESEEAARLVDAEEFGADETDPPEAA